MKQIVQNEIKIYDLFSLNTFLETIYKDDYFIFWHQKQRAMGLFSKLFGSESNKGKAPTPQEAIQKLLEIEELLRKRQDVLEKKIEDELTIAKTNGVKNKRGKNFL